MLLTLLVACVAPEADGPRSRLLDPQPAAPPEPAPVVTSASGPDPGEWLLETDEVRKVRLEIGEPELESLATAPEAWVPANLAIDGIVVREIAVRLKGHGSFQPIDQKPSFKLSLDRYDEDNELDGLDDLVLNNMVVDPSFLRERLAYAVYREVGVPAPRAAHVEVEVNGEHYGLYLLLEDVDGRFLERWFDDPDGPLYELYDVDLTPPEIWQLEHETGPDDRSSLVALADVLIDVWTRLSVDGDPYLDVEQFGAYFGASAVIGQFDAYPYSFPGDDVYLYVDPEDGRVHFIAHGGDETFSDSFRPADYVFGLLALRCLEDVACEEAFTGAIWSTMTAIEQMDLDRLRQEWDEDVDEYILRDLRSPWRLEDVWDAQQAVNQFIDTRRERLEEMPGIEPR